MFKINSANAYFSYCKQQQNLADAR